MFVTLTVVFASCTSRYMIPDISPKKGFEVTVVDPASSIELVPRGAGNVSIFSDSLTFLAKENLTIGMSQYLSNFYQVHHLEFDTETNRLIDIQLYQMTRKLKSQRKVKRVPLPPSLDSIMDLNNIDHAVCAVHLGYSREEGSYQAGYFKGFLIAVLSLGTYNDIPRRSASDLSIFVIDGRNDQIAFHRRSNWRNLDPSNKEVTDRQIASIFKKYFKNLKTTSTVKRN